MIGVSREVRSSTVLDPLNDLPEFYTPVTLGSSQVSVGIRCSEVCPDETVIRERVRAKRAYDEDGWTSNDDLRSVHVADVRCWCPTADTVFPWKLQTR